MSQLFDLGFRLGKSGTEWKKTPPRLGIHREERLARTLESRAIVLALMLAAVLI